jgi:hypothetical protein
MSTITSPRNTSIQPTRDSRAWVVGSSAGLTAPFASAWFAIIFVPYSGFGGGRISFRLRHRTVNNHTILKSRLSTITADIAPDNCDIDNC